MRTLVLLRHGKSAYPADVDDHERPLNSRGRREASIAGLRLAESLSREKCSVDLALVSSAVRAQETWQLVATHLSVGEEQTRPDLYLAEQGELLDVVRALPTIADCVLVVGHNNGLEDLASTLTATTVLLKTSTFAVLSSDAPWGHWRGGEAVLREVVIAR